MKPAPRAEAERWLAQAKSDLDFARLGLREGFFAQACFQCQPAAEKALKALHYFGGARFVPGHSLVELLAPLAALDPSLAALQEAARCSLNEQAPPSADVSVVLPGGFLLFQPHVDRIRSIRRLFALIPDCHAEIRSGYELTAALARVARPG